MTDFYFLCLYYNFTDQICQCWFGASYKVCSWWVRIHLWCWSKGFWKDASDPATTRRPVSL